MSTRIRYLSRLCRDMLWLFAILFCSLTCSLLCSLTCSAMALEVEHVCGKQAQFDKTKAPTTGWTTGTGNVYPKQPCWLRIPHELGDAKLLSFKAVWIDINLYDANGKLFASAIHLGKKNQAIVSANRISFLTSNATFPLYARLDVSPSTSYFDQVEVESLDLNESMHRAQTFDSISVAQTAILVGFAVIAAAFGLLLRNLTYVLFALFCIFRAAFLIFNNGLIFSLWDIPDWLPQLFILTSWPSNAIQSLIVTRMSGSAEHSPKLHYAMLAMAALYISLIPIDIYFPYQSLGLQDYLDMVWYPVALIGVGRAVFLKRAGSAILFLGLIPMAIFWWPLAVAQLLPRSFGLSFETPSGTTLDIIQNLFFPTLFCISLAYRSLQLHREAIRIARIDKLTGLPNRERLTHRGDSLLKSKGNPPIAVAALNIDRFRAINEALGYDTGDAALIEVGRRLAAIPMAIVGRSQSDQFFTIWLDASKLDELQLQIQQLFFAPILVNQQMIDISMSVGVANLPELDMSLQMRCAEIALNVARHEKTAWEIYKPEMETAKLGDLHLLSELRTAINKNQLRLFLQPKVRLKDGAVVSAEALVRWEHPERGMVPPYQFIPFAEHTGHISAITVWMLTQAMQIVAERRAAGNPLQISVNLSAFDLRNNHIVTILETLRETYGASSSDIRLEVTESSVMSHPEISLQVLHAIHEAGYSIAIDDFGTGYSSLAYLQKMPVTELKIDRAFVSGVQANTDAAILLFSTIELGQRLNLSIVAEGVETADEWALLEGFGCDYIQGWFAAKAMPVSDFINWRKEQSPFHFKEYQVS
ncbi:MAG: EAL domain-containing protein [Pseudomonadota bacterium]